MATSGPQKMCAEKSVELVQRAMLLRHLPNHLREVLRKKAFQLRMSHQAKDLQRLLPRLPVILQNLL